MSSNFHLSTGWAIALGASSIFAIIYPLALAFAANRKLAVSWRYFGFGVLIFGIFQVVTRVPIVQIVGNAYHAQIAASPALTYGWLAVLVVSAALFEEVGRYLGYRWFMRREDKTWAKAVMYGLGHGGLESILLVGLGGLASLLNIMLLSTMSLTALPAAQRQVVAEQLHAIANQPGWYPLLGGWERLWTVPVQVALSVLVVQVFRRGNIGWLWVAIGAHMLVDGVAVAVPQVFKSSGWGSVAISLLIEGIVAVFGLCAIWIIWALRDRQQQTAAPAGPVTPTAAPSVPHP